MIHHIVVAGRCVSLILGAPALRASACAGTPPQRPRRIAVGPERDAECCALGTRCRPRLKPGAREAPSLSRGCRGNGNPHLAPFQPPEGRLRAFLASGFSRGRRATVLNLLVILNTCATAAGRCGGAPAPAQAEARRAGAPRMRGKDVMYQETSTSTSHVHDHGVRL